MSIDDLCCMWPPLDRDAPALWTKYGLINETYLEKYAGFFFTETTILYHTLARLKANGEIVKEGRAIYNHQILTAGSESGHFH